MLRGGPTNSGLQTDGILARFFGKGFMFLMVTADAPPPNSRPELQPDPLAALCFMRVSRLTLFQ
jgi:hypothetical protein